MTHDEASAEKFVERKTKNKKRRDAFRKMLLRELEANPCYFEERWAKYCQFEKDTKSMGMGNYGMGQFGTTASTPQGGFRRPPHLDCFLLMRNSTNCTKMWYE